MKTLYESLLDDEEDLMDNSDQIMLKHQIEEWLEKYCTIQGGGYEIKYNKKKVIVNIKGNIHITGDFDTLPIDLFKLLITSYKGLGSLIFEDCPNLKTLIGCPRSIKGYLRLINCNNIKSLESSPVKKAYGFQIWYCKNFESLIGCPEIPPIATGYVHIENCPKLQSLQGLTNGIKKLILNDLNITNLIGCPNNEKLEVEVTDCKKLKDTTGLPKNIKNFKQYK